MRGPDATNVVIDNDWTFVHNLLHMTGNRTLQPFVNNQEQVMALFNGEIYNYKKLHDKYFSATHQPFASDGYAIIPTYLHCNKDLSFVKKFHGEFAIVLVDLKQGIVVLSSDTFATKPLWYGQWTDGLGRLRFMTASYESVLIRSGAPKESRHMLEANTILALDIHHGFRLVERRTIFNFDLVQFKTDTFDFIRAFKRAVAIRVRDIIHKVFIGLSDGYDSGSILKSLCETNSSALAYTIHANENIQIVKDRIKWCKDAQIESVIITPSEQAFEDEREWVKGHVEYFPYGEWPLPQSNWIDAASSGLSIILRHVRQQGGVIYLSGSGADEIISDYSDPVSHETFRYECFKGVFPSNLSTIFPWCNFYDRAMRAFIMKEETIGGAHGIETRYPFLDPLVVQEFLWLTPELKNSMYKRPIYDYLTLDEFPMVRKKNGFGADTTLVRDGGESQIDVSYSPAFKRKGEEKRSYLSVPKDEAEHQIPALDCRFFQNDNNNDGTDAPTPTKTPTPMLPLTACSNDYDYLDWDTIAVNPGAVSAVAAEASRNMIFSIDFTTDSEYLNYIALHHNKNMSVVLLLDGDCVGVARGAHEKSVIHCQEAALTAGIHTFEAVMIDTNTNNIVTASSVTTAIQHDIIIR